LGFVALLEVFVSWFIFTFVVLVALDAEVVGAFWIKLGYSSGCSSTPKGFSLIFYSASFLLSSASSLLASSSTFFATSELLAASYLASSLIFWASLSFLASRTAGSTSCLAFYVKLPGSGGFSTTPRGISLIYLATSALFSIFSRCLACAAALIAISSASFATRLTH